MQKAKSFNQASVKISSLVVAFLALVAPVLTQAQPAMNQVIEQAKKSKLQELLPPPPPAPVPAALPSKKASAPVEKVVAIDPPDPALWSLSGINDAMTAEIVMDNKFHRFSVRPGLLLPGDWTVIAVNPESLTLRNNKKTIDLLPSPKGSTGAEYAALIKPKAPEGGLAGIQESLNSRGFPIEILSGTEPNKAVGGTEASREAASSLPKR